MKKNKKINFYEALKNRVLTLDIEPGTVLDETALSLEYDISRTPLREVFQRLAGEGYLTLENNRSTKVSSMDISSMRNFFQTAPVIYASVARLAAENATATQLKQLKQIQHSFLQQHKFQRVIAIHKQDCCPNCLKIPGTIQHQFYIFLHLFQ